MKKALIFVLAVSVLSSLILSTPRQAEAKTAYYKSASTGRFTTKSSYRSSPSTTYRSYIR